MAAILQAVLFFFTLGFAHATASLDSVHFLENTCQYDKYFFNTRYNISENCTWLSCDVKNQRVTVDQCEDINRVYPSSPYREFPDCCWLKQDRGRKYFGYTTRIYEAGLLKVTSETVKRVYAGNLTGQELCNRSHRYFCPEGHVAESCCGVTYNETKNTTEVKWCPFVDNSNAPKGALVSPGRSNARYPNCCPEYLHGPAKSYCPCGENNRSPCSYKSCNGKQDEKCIPRVELERRGCKVQLEECPLKTSDRRCPRMMCPNITEEAVEDSYHREYVYESSTDVEIGKNKCTYKKTPFSSTVKGSKPCELWTCELDEKRVLITKCSNETLPEHCEWTDGDKDNMFPHCCPRKKCEKEYIRLS